MPALARARRNAPRQQQGFEPLRPIEGRKVETVRRFVARLSDRRGPATTIDATDFMQAALTYAEDCPAQNVTTLNISVTDVETAETHCFRIVVD